MSANPTRVDWDAASSADSGLPLQAGNCVLQAIASQETMGALLAFSDLHRQIRERHLSAGRDGDGDLFETERFILDEVLQLICDRVQAITQADGIVVALPNESKPGTSVNRAINRSPHRSEGRSEGGSEGGSEMVCRAASGPLGIKRGVHLIGESEFLQDCLEAGSILRCDDCQIDTRVELDFSHAVGARSTVLVPLRGRHQPLGVLQAFSITPWAFTDHDVRCFALFAELLLSALRPEDQDRRAHWLSDVAADVLGKKPVAAVAPVKVSPIDPGDPVIETGLATPLPVASAVAEELLGEDLPEQHLPEQDLFEQDLADEESHAIAEIANTEPLHSPPLSLPLRVPLVHRLSLASGSHPGLSVVLGLAAVAALFSAGAWWGMRLQGNTPVTKLAAAKAKPVAAPLAQPATTPTAPPADLPSTAVSDNLLDPSKLSADTAPLTAVAESKLGALPKVTGVRHWSSSIGSTVVIDMEDQVPYEVHRLMSPERIYFDLHDTVLSRELDGKTIEVGDPSLTRVRIGQPVAGVTRVVLDTKDGSNFSVSMESNPYRLVVELRGSEKTSANKHASPNQISPNQITPNHAAVNQTPAVAAAKPAPAAALAAKVSDQPAPARTGRFRIVLDAGHGGWDLGTVGRQGLLEKDLVLDVTERLGKLLQTRLEAEVMLTRTNDSYLPLDQRADIANQSQADLFVSVHANYSSSAAARGVETYYTNLFSAPRGVEKHDDGSFSNPTQVSLSASGLHEKIEESRRLATSVQHSLYATLAATSPDIRNRGIKDAAFAVLTGTTMPAILTEISFVSSPADERKLQSAAYRQQIAEAIYRGIAHYQENSPRAKIAQLQKPSSRQ